jgi:branched-chain amino acid transport system ATP-binding protein
MLEIWNLTKNIGGLIAVNNVSFNVYEKEIVGVIGPNGAGKTTLFNLISGVLNPTSGRIIFDGKDITNLPIHKRARMGIARTFQIPRPFEDMTVLDSVAVSMLTDRNKKNSLNEARDRALGILENLKLGEKAFLHVRQLNLQEKKLVELARALACEPRLLLVDEFMSGLNPAEVEDAVNLLRKINEENNVTVIWIEHVLRAVMKLAHRVIVLNFGKKIAEGTPKEISENTEVINAYIGGQTS